MAAEILALSAAFFFALSNVLISKGLDKGTILQAVFVSLLVNTAVLWTLSLAFVDLQLFMTTAIIWFILAGILAPGLGRVFNFSAINHLGVSISSPIIGLSPLFSVFVSIVFLKEPFSLLIFGGVFLIILGIYILTLGRNHKKFDKKYLLLPLGAALFYGLAIPLNKLGLLNIGNPILAATITSTTSLFIILVYLSAVKGLKRLKLTRHATIFYTLSGLATVMAFTLHFTALNLGNVSMIAPLVSTFPLFAVILSHLLLRHKERITLHVWLGALVVVSGVIVISIV